MKTSKLTFSFVLFISCLHSQIPEVDSITNLITNAGNDTTKVYQLLSLAEFYSSENIFDTSIIYQNQAIELANKINYAEGLGRAYTQLGTNNTQMGNYSMALTNYFSALEVVRRSGNKKREAGVLNNIGNVYEYLGNHTEAIKYFLQSLNIKERLGNKLSISNTLTNLGNSYFFYGNKEQALEYYLRSLNLIKELDDIKEIAEIYLTIGNVLTEYKDKKKQTEGLDYYLRALAIAKETGDSRLQYFAHINIGDFYLKENDFIKARTEFSLALSFSKDLNDPRLTSTALTSLGSVYTKSKDHKNAELFLNQGLELALKIRSGVDIVASYQALSQLDSSKANFKDAFAHYKLYILYRDSSINEKNATKNVQMQMQYDFDKKQLADSLKISEERKLTAIKFEQEKKQRYFLYSGLILVIIFAGFIFNRFKVTQKQKQIIERKEQETQQQKHLIEEKQKEILDSIKYARRIQSALITSEKYFEKSLNKLNNEQHQ